MGAVKRQKVTTTAGERLRTHAPEGPPFLGLMLDEPTVRCLALGVVNARAEVAARKCIAELEAETFVTDDGTQQERSVAVDPVARAHVDRNTRV